MGETPLSPVSRHVSEDRPLLKHLHGARERDGLTHIFPMSASFNLSSPPFSSIGVLLSLFKPSDKLQRKDTNHQHDIPPRSYVRCYIRYPQKCFA